MNKKYKLTDETIQLNGKTLHRIECVTSFGGIEKGEKGGFVESESNLSENGDAWVYCNAKVCDDAKVYGNAKVCDDAKVYGNAEVYDNAKVYNNAKVNGNAEVYGNAKVCGDTKVYDNAKVCGDAWVCGNAEVYDNSLVYGNAKVCGDTKVYGDAIIRGNASVCGNAKVCGNADVYGDATIRGNTIVKKQDDYIVFKNNWSSGRYFTYTKSNDMWSVGCFYGTGKELIEKAYKDSEVSGKHYEAYVKFVENLKAIHTTGETS